VRNFVNRYEPHAGSYSLKFGIIAATCGEALWRWGFSSSWLSAIPPRHCALPLPNGAGTLLANIHQTFINRPKHQLIKQSGTNKSDYLSY
jgi:hypothetical protein